MDDLIGEAEHVELGADEFSEVASEGTVRAAERGENDLRAPARAVVAVLPDAQRGAAGGDDARLFLVRPVEEVAERATGAMGVEALEGGHHAGVAEDNGVGAGFLVCATRVLSFPRAADRPLVRVGIDAFAEVAEFLHHAGEIECAKVLVPLRPPGFFLGRAAALGLVLGLEREPVAQV